MLEDDSFEKTALTIATALRLASNGDRAEARRMGAGQGTALFWRVAASLDIPQHDESNWKRFTTLVALLTTHDEKRELHNRNRPLGAVLADGGDASLNLNKPDAKPVFSEARLARMLAARGASFETALDRAVRMLAPKKPQIDVVGLAHAVFGHGTDRIARDFYNRIDKFRTEDVTND